MTGGSLLHAMKYKPIANTTLLQQIKEREIERQIDKDRQRDIDKQIYRQLERKKLAKEKDNWKIKIHTAAIEIKRKSYKYTDKDKNRKTYIYVHL